MTQASSGCVTLWESPSVSSTAFLHGGTELMNSQTTAHLSYCWSCWFLRDDEEHQAQQRAGEKSTPQGAGLQNLCPRAYLIMGLIRPPLPESPEYQVCRVPCKLWHSLRPEQGPGTAGSCGCSCLLAGWSLFYPAFPSERRHRCSPTAMMLGGCAAVCTRFFSQLLSWLLFPSFGFFSPLLSLTFFKRKHQKWILQQLEERKRSWESRTDTGAKEWLTGKRAVTRGTKT